MRYFYIVRELLKENAPDKNVGCDTIECDGHFSLTNYCNNMLKSDIGRGYKFCLITFFKELTEEDYKEFMK